jgi:hypothetical protein
MWQDERGSPYFKDKIMAESIEEQRFRIEFNTALIKEITNRIGVPMSTSTVGTYRIYLTKEDVPNWVDIYIDDGIAILSVDGLGLCPTKREIDLAEPDSIDIIAKAIEDHLKEEWPLEST